MLLMLLILLMLLMCFKNLEGWGGMEAWPLAGSFRLELPNLPGFRIARL